MTIKPKNLDLLALNTDPTEVAKKQQANKKASTAEQVFIKKLAEDQVNVSTLSAFLSNQLSPETMKQERADKVQALKEQYQNGTLKAAPSEIVADRIVTYLTEAFEDGQNWYDDEATIG